MAKIYVISTRNIAGGFVQYLSTEYINGQYERDANFECGGFDADCKLVKGQKAFCVVRYHKDAKLLGIPAKGQETRLVFASASASKAKLAKIREEMKDTSCDFHYFIEEIEVR